MSLSLGLLVFLNLAWSTHEIMQGELVHEWVYLDFIWPTPEARQEAIDNGDYVVENNALSGIKVYNGSIYVTVPRWTPGVPSTLNKVVTVDGETLLEPYPSWEMQEPDDCNAFQYVQSMEIDPNTGYMWVIDVGRRNIWEWPPDNVSINACPAKLVIIDINTNETIHTYEFPEEVLTREGNFVNDIVIDPEGGYAYMSDTGTGPTGHPGGIIFYDMNTGTSRRIEHVSMQPDPDYIGFIINDKVYAFNTSVDGIALNPERTLLHYTALTGVNVYQVPTSAVRDPNVDFDNSVRRMGTRPSQGDGMFMSARRLYVGCLSRWRYQNTIYDWGYRYEMNLTGKGLDELNIAAMGLIYGNETTMTWPDTFAMDEDGYLYVVSNRLNEFRYREMDFSGASGPNFRVLRFPTVDDRSYLYPFDYPDTDPGVVDGSSKSSGSFITVLAAVVLTVINIRK